MEEQEAIPAEEKKIEAQVAEPQQERVLKFGKLPKFDAENMWRCDVMTGIITKATLNKSYEMENRGTTKNGKIIRVKVKTYWIMTKTNYFYLPAETAEAVVPKFEAEFERAGEQIAKMQEEHAKKKEEVCLKKV
jgi:hypothetical protein